jgi:hypothetical protein
MKIRNILTAACLSFFLIPKINAGIGPVVTPTPSATPSATPCYFYIYVFADGSLADATSITATNVDPFTGAIHTLNLTRQSRGSYVIPCESIIFDSYFRVVVSKTGCSSAQKFIKLPNGSNSTAIMLNCSTQK